jgi:hypothetical protein
MKLDTGGLWFVAFCCSARMIAFAQTPADDARFGLKPGLVVERIVSNFAADKVSLKEKDVLLRWRRGDAEDEIRSPFDLALVELEQVPQAPNGEVRLEGPLSCAATIWMSALLVS